MNSAWQLLIISGGRELGQVILHVQPPDAVCCEDVAGWLDILCLIKAGRGDSQHFVISVCQLASAVSAEVSEDTLAGVVGFWFVCCPFQ